MSKIEQLHRERFPDELFKTLIKVPSLNDMEIPFAAYKYLQWSNNPWTWIIEQVYTIDEGDQGRIKAFPNYAYLGHICGLYFERKIVDIPKTRRMMLTHLFASGILPHQLIFRENSDNIFVSTSEKKAKKVFRRKCKQTLNSLDRRFFFHPEFQEKKTIFTGGCINPYNNAELAAVPSGSDKCRGDTLSNAIYDEFAFQDYCEENLEAVKPALDGADCRAAFISSPNPGTVFEDLTRIKKGSDFKQVMQGLSITDNELNHLIIKCHYLAHPYKRTKEWYFKERYGTTPDGTPIPNASGVRTYTWLKEYEGHFNFPRGRRVISEFTEELHCQPYKELYPNGYAGGLLLIGVDFGSNFPCVCFIEKDTANRAVLHGGLMVAGERQDAFNVRVFNHLNEYYPGWEKNFKIFPDPSGYKGTRGGNADPEATELEKFFKKRATNRKKVIPVQDGLEAINDLMATKHGDAMGMIVAPDAGTYVNEIGEEEHGIFTKAFHYGYCYKDKKNAKAKGHTNSGIEVDKDGFFDHPVDTVRFVIGWVWKSRKQREKQITEARADHRGDRGLERRSQRRALRR